MKLTEKHHKYSDFKTSLSVPSIKLITNNEHWTDQMRRAAAKMYKAAGQIKSLT